MLRPLKSTAGTTGRERFEVFVRCYPWHTMRGAYGFRQEPPSAEELRSEVMDGHMQIPGLVIPKESWSKINTRFEARPDHLNEWTVTLPEELITTVRVGLKADPSGKENPPVSAVAPYAR